MKRNVLPFLLAVFLVSCETGLTPPPDFEAGFGGTLTFASWPPRDSVKNLWLFASQIYPLDSVKIFEGLFSSPPKIFLYPSFVESLPYDVDSVQYRFAPLRAGRYRYIGVIQQFNDVLTIRSFRVVGVYKNPADTTLPGELQFREFEFIEPINLRVDFANPPPQPF
jgi:hypothetical protein